MREKMSANNRARQFLPFDSMKGLQEALRAAEFENESVSHHRLSEDEARRIGSVLSQLNEKKQVHVRYFEEGHYYDLEGEAKLDPYESLLVFEEKNIPIFDIYQLNLL